MYLLIAGRSEIPKKGEGKFEKNRKDLGHCHASAPAAAWGLMHVPDLEDCLAHWPTGSSVQVLVQAFFVSVIVRYFKGSIPWFRLRLYIPVEKQNVRAVSNNGLGLTKHMATSTESYLHSILENITTNPFHHSPYSASPEPCWRSHFNAASQQSINEVSVVALHRVLPFRH